MNCSETNKNVVLLLGVYVSLHYPTDFDFPVSCGGTRILIKHDELTHVICMIFKITLCSNEHLIVYALKFLSRIYLKQLISILVLFGIWSLCV